MRIRDGSIAKLGRRATTALFVLFVHEEIMKVQFYGRVTRLRTLCAY